MAMTLKQRKRSMAGFIGANGGVPAAPANTDAPTIAGTAQVGETLTADPGTWDGRPAPSLFYQWLADGEAIDGATSSTYEPVEDDIGKAITVAVTARNRKGSATATSDATDAVAAAS